MRADQRSGVRSSRTWLVLLVLLVTVMELATAASAPSPSEFALPPTGPHHAVGGATELAEARASLTHGGPLGARPEGNATYPPLREYGSMVWDGHDGYVLLFGGCEYTVTFGCNVNDTWEFSGGAWAELFPAQAPPAMDQGAMAYDSTSGYVVLFGGQSGSWGVFPAVVNDTWEFQAGVWTNVTGSIAPAPRMGASLADDPSVGGLTLYGGNTEFTYNTSNGTRLRSFEESDTWTFAAGAWTNVSAPVGTPPPARSDAVFESDPSLSGSEAGDLVLFGGVSPASGQSQLNDTWLLGASGWDNITQPRAPPPLASSSLAYLASTGRLILFGGERWVASGEYYLDSNQTWAFWNNSWSELPEPVAPPPTEGGTFVGIPTSGYALLLLGSTEGTVTPGTASWTFSNTSWSPLGANATTPAGGPATMVYDAADGVVVMVAAGAEYAGGSQTSEATWTYRGGNWSASNSTPAPPARINAQLVYDAADSYVLLTGGASYVNGQYLADTWKFSGGNWTELFPIHSPPLSDSGAIAYDATDGYVLYFVGTTWTWAGGDWTKLNLTVQPDFHGIGPGANSMTFDAHDGYVLLASADNVSEGGVGSTPLLTWSFAHGSWTNLTASSTLQPPAYRDAAVVYDPALDEVVMFGGYVVGSSDPSLDLNLTSWSWSGGQWSEFGTPTNPGDRFEAASTYDGRDGYLLLFGGATYGAGNLILLADSWTFAGGAWTEADPLLSVSVRVADDGVATTFAVEGSALLGGTTYSYAGLPGGCASVDRASWVCTPTASGSYLVTVSLASITGAYASASSTLLVNPLPVISAFTASPTSLALGNSTELSVGITGGTAPFTFTYVGLPTGCASQNFSTLVCLPSQAGNFTVRVQVLDAWGMGATATLALSVAGPATIIPPALGPPAGVPWVVLVGLGAVVGAGVVGLAGFTSFRRRRVLHRDAEELVAEMRRPPSAGKP